MGDCASALDYLNNTGEINDKKNLKRSLLTILEKEKKSMVRKAAVTLLSKIEKSDALETVRGVLSRDSSVAVLGAAMNVLKEIDSVQALNIAREFRSSKEAEIKAGAAEIMGEFGNAQDLPFIEQLILSGEMKNYHRLRALLSYVYLVIRNGSEFMSNAAEIMAYTKENGNQYTGWYFDLILEKFMEILQSEQEGVDEELQQLGNEEDKNKMQSLKNKKANLEKLYNGLSPMIDTEDPGY